MYVYIDLKSKPPYFSNYVKIILCCTYYEGPLR